MNTRTWPRDWEDRRAGVGCPKCQRARNDEDESGGVRFFTGQFGDGYRQRRAPQRGYSIVSFHRRHVPDLTVLTLEESAGFWSDVIAVARVLETVFTPCHFNYDVLGNSVPHLHVHVVPRYLDDPCPRMLLKPWRTEAVEPSVFASQLEALRQTVSPSSEA